MKKLPDLKSFLRWQLRKISLRWPARTQAMARARVERGAYKCEGCKQIKKAKEIQVDHVVAVVGPEGFTNWDDFIIRLFCSADGYQILCIDCHQIKTQAENQERKNASNAKLKSKGSDVQKKKAIKRKKKKF